ncbi:hypothetical protein PMIN04_006804 [Paraphaeosphaeria minitans]
MVHVGSRFTMKFFSKREKLPYARKRPIFPTSSQIAIPPRSSHTPPPLEVHRLPRPEPIPQAPREPQIIQDRYIDGDKLLALCQERYGIENCRLKVRCLFGVFYHHVIAHASTVQERAILPSSARSHRRGNPSAMRVVRHEIMA